MGIQPVPVPISNILGLFISLRIFKTSDTKISVSGLGINVYSLTKNLRP